MASSMSHHRQFGHSHLLLFLIAERLLKQADALEQQAESTEQEAMKKAEETVKQARIQQLEIAVKELQERINAANKGKPLQGLPESWKHVHEEDADSLMTTNEDSPGNSELQHQNQPMAKIPKKLTDMTACFNAVDE